MFQLGITKNLDSNKNNLQIDLKKFVDSPYGAHWETAFKIWQDNKFIGVGVTSLESSVLIISISKLNQNLDRLDAQPILIILTWKYYLKLV